MSVNCSMLEMGNKYMRPFFNFSLTMWKSISMCFVRSWNTGFDAMYLVESLSHYKKRWFLKRIFEILMKISKPLNFTCNSGYFPIFSFTVTLWYCSLLLWFLGYEGIPKIHTKTIHGFSWITIGASITITKGF